MVSPFVRCPRALVLALLALTLVAHRGRAQNCDWDIKLPNYHLVQSNGWDAYVFLDPYKPKVVVGNLTSVFTNPKTGKMQWTDDNNPLDGTFDGKKLTFRVNYLDGKIGVYDLNIDEGGLVEGVTYDFKQPQNRIVVLGVDRLQCKGSTPPPSPPSPPAPQSYIVPRSDAVRAQASHTTGIVKSTTARCVGGFVWRAASPDDHVCVSTDARMRTVRENLAAASLWTKVPPGSRLCVSGYVWREALSDDRVCVAPATRDIVRRENREAPSHAAK